MARQDLIDYDDSTEHDEQKLRRDAFRSRRTAAGRRRISTKKPSQPGGIRQRRNKHWNW